MSDVNSEKTARVSTNPEDQDQEDPYLGIPPEQRRTGLVPKWRVTWFDEEKETWEFMDYANADIEQAANLAMAVDGIVHRFYAPAVIGSGQGALEPWMIKMALNESEPLDRIKREREKREQSGWFRPSSKPSKPTPATGGFRCPPRSPAP